MSSEDIRAEHPQVEHIAFSSSKLPLYFATPVIKAHGTVAPGWKGGGWCSREPSQLTHRLTCTSYSTPSSPWLRLENTGGIAQKPGVSLLLVSKKTLFFQHRRHWGVTHWQEERLPLLPSAALEAWWFQQAADQRIPSQNTDLATPLWFHTARLTSQGNYPTEQHRKSWQEFTLMLKISSFSLTVNSSLPCRFKESSSLTLHSCLTCTILHLTNNSSNTVNSCHAYLWLYFALVLRKACMRKHI